MAIPGKTQAYTARQIAEMIDAKWPSGKGITDEEVGEVKKALKQLVKEGVVKVDTEPRYRPCNTNQAKKANS